MPPIPENGTVAVTGAAGFIGGWVVKGLLDRGYRVRACVRSVEDETRVGFLKALGAFASGRLTLHAADLNEPGCFDEVFKGCDGVCHVSIDDRADDSQGSLVATGSRNRLGYHAVPPACGMITAPSSAA